MTCPHIISGCNYPEGECSGACLPKPVSAFAKEARAELRRLLAEEEIMPHADEARRIFAMAATDLAVGEAMTVYAQGSAIRAMHAALGDPWQIEPRATIVGAFLAAIASRLIEARRVR